jgi:hypothetical protein
MNKSILYLFLTITILHSGCTKQEDQTAQQSATSFLGVENITDYTLHDVLEIHNTEGLNVLGQNTISYDVYQFFSKLGKGNGSVMSVNEITADQLNAINTNYHFRPDVRSNNDIINIQYRKASSGSRIGNYTHTASLSKELHGTVSFNKELGMDKTKDLEFKWLPDESNSDEKVFISVCIADSPCLFYETDDSGSYTIPASAVSHVKSGVWGMINVTRAAVSSLSTIGGAPLKVVRSTTGRVIFDVI